MHRMAEEVQRAVSIPLLHIADVTAEAIKAQEIEKIGLLGTKFTMEEPYYRGRLEDEHGLEVIVPEAQARTVVHRVIYDELVVGLIRDQSKSSFVAIMKDLESAGAQGIILGCTEIGLLVGQEDARVPVFDTTHLHASAAVHFALEAHT
jgi:aspartate racemase